MKNQIRVALVEDNQEYRKIVTIALTGKEDIELLSQFSTAEAALRSLPNSKPLPDLILLDLRLPGMTGIESIPWFRQALPNAKIIVLSQSDQEADVLNALSQGASGYLLKSSTLYQIVDAIRSVMAGGTPLDAKIASFIIKQIDTPSPKTNEATGLSAREFEILTLLSEGKVKKEIAADLAISYATVDTHIRNIYNKLDVYNAPSAVSKAYKNGLF